MLKKIRRWWLSNFEYGPVGRAIFVYGSLKRGKFNHERFGLHKARFIGEATLKGHRMVNLGPYPAIIRVDDQNKVVHGEVYDVDQDTVTTLNGIEQGAGFYPSTRLIQLNRGDWVMGLFWAYHDTGYGFIGYREILEGKW